MKSLIFGLLLTAGGVLLLFGVVFSQSPPQFGPPQNLGPKINSSFYESDPFWDGPRNRLYFAKAGPMTNNGNPDIWFAEWTDTGWTDPKPVGGGINTQEIEQSPSVSPDGQKLFYVGFFRPGSPTAWDVWMSSWDSSQSDWGPPVNLGCPISTPGVEFSARIAPDGKTLYFYSTQSTCDSMTPWYTGLVSSVWDSVSGWSPPLSLGRNINTGNDEQYPSVTGDGKWLYFERLLPINGISIFVSPWTDTGWGTASNLESQIGGWASAPFISFSGDSLFFASFFLGGSGSSDIYATYQVPLGVGDVDKAGLPRFFELYQNFPNPFNSKTRIQFFISKNSKGSAKLTVYNLLGQPVQILIEYERLTGKGEIEWDGRDAYGKEVSSGLYFYELRVGDQRVVKKMVLIR